MRHLVAVALVLLGLGRNVASLFDPALKVCTFSLEVIFLQDFSSSFEDDRLVLEMKLPELLEGIEHNYPGSRTGFGTFVDKPLEFFGNVYAGDWFTGDWCHNVTSPISSADPATIVDEMKDLAMGGGADHSENQLGAIHDIALNSSLTGWTDNPVDPYGNAIKRVIILSTDSAYHTAGDGKNSSWELRENDGDGYTECTGEDYPSIEQVRAALRSRDIYVVFLVQNNMVDVYSDLLVELDVQGGAISLKDNSSDILEKLSEAFSDMNTLTCDTSSLDIVFSLDSTWSYKNDITTLAPRIDALSFQLAQDFTCVRFGLTSFGDKPLTPLGHEGSGDYCYKVHQSLTLLRSDLVDAIGTVRRTSGLDWRESQLDAIISSAVDPAVEWRVGNKWNGFDLHRVLVLATDAGYHRAPDGANRGHSLASHSGGLVNCTGEEYPDWHQAAQALVAKDVHPLFVPTSDVARIYRKLLSDMESHYGVIGEVVELKDFDEFTEVVREGVRRLEAKLQLIGSLHRGRNPLPTF